MNLLRLGKNHEYIHTLLKIKEYLPEAIIAGGAIRDMYHKKPIRDIDVYIKKTDTTPIYQTSFWQQLFALDNTTDYIEHSGKSYTGKPYTGKTHIGMVWEIRKNGIMYNIIVTDIDPVDYVEQFFDIGLCKAYCDGTKIRLTADFMHDSRNKLLTVVSKHLPQDEFDGMMDRHIAKLRKKYHDYKLVIPAMYKDFYTAYKKH